MQKVAQDLVAMLGADAFGVKLNAFDGQGFVAQAHDGAIFQTGGDFEAIGQGFTLHHQGMIAGRKERRGQAVENARSVVMHRTHLAMHNLMATDHTAAKRLANRLMPKADAQQGNASRRRRRMGQGQADASLCGGARAGRQHNHLGAKRHGCGHIQCIIADHADIRAKFAQIMHQIIGETVIIVDQKQHIIWPIAVHVCLGVNPSACRAIHGAGGTGASRETLPFPHGSRYDWAGGLRLIRGFLMGTGLGIVVAGVGLVVASQVTDMALVEVTPAGTTAGPITPERLETVPPAVEVANAPADAPVLAPDLAPVLVPSESPVAKAAPALPQDAAAVLESGALAGSAPMVPAPGDGPVVVEAAPALPEAATVSDTQTDLATQPAKLPAKIPSVQNEMAAPAAPAVTEQMPVVPQADAAGPASAGANPSLPQTTAMDAPPATDEAATDTAAAEVPAPALPAPALPAPAAAETPGLRPAPGFASKAVEGVKSGRLPSIGAAPANVEAQPAQAEPVVVLVDDPDAPPIERFAAPFENPGNKPLFAILLQDTGGPDIDREALAAIPFPVTFVIDPTQPDAATAAQLYRAAGKEVLMLASGIPEGATASDLAVSMEVTSAALPEAVGLVDLENGGFQGNRALATQVLALIRDQGRGVISWDRGLNAASQVAQREGMRHTTIFRSIDGEDEASPLIRRYLDRAAFKAAQDGRVVVAGRTRPQTVAALLEWALEGRAATMALAPATAVMTAR